MPSTCRLSQQPVVVLHHEVEQTGPVLPLPDLLEDQSDARAFRFHAPRVVRKLANASTKNRPTTIFFAEGPSTLARQESDRRATGARQESDA